MKTFELKTIAHPRIRLVNCKSRASLLRAVKNDLDKPTYFSEANKAGNGSWEVVKGDVLEPICNMLI